MFFKNIFTATIVASVTLVKAIDLCAWPSSNSCTGFATCCFNQPRGACCASLAQTVGFSVSYRPLEDSTAFGEAWTASDCKSGGIGTGQVGPGDRCWNGLGTKANSIAWAHFGDPSPRDLSAKNSTCTAPNAFVFTSNGVEKAIKIPGDAGAVDTLIDLYQKGDFATLEGFEAAEFSRESLSTLII
ncbi:hypothetical protein C8J56DRAFT_1083817 [Mycena floridula]|nr:hypothetical protein C8J56DRAFT_1083817 [Mycena floridula]